MYLLLEHGTGSFESILLFSSLQCYVAKEWECGWGWDGGAGNSLSWGLSTRH